MIYNPLIQGYGSDKIGSGVGSSTSRPRATIEQFINHLNSIERQQRQNTNNEIQYLRNIREIFNGLDDTYRNSSGDFDSRVYLNELARRLGIIDRNLMELENLHRRRTEDERRFNTTETLNEIANRQRIIEHERTNRHIFVQNPTGNPVLGTRSRTIERERQIPTPRRHDPYNPPSTNRRSSSSDSANSQYERYN